MAKLKKKHLLRLGYEPGEALKEALLAAMDEKLARKSRNALMDLFQDVLRRPDQYIKHQILGKTAVLLAPEAVADAPELPQMRDQLVPLAVYGEAQIEPGAHHQMAVAARLPVARQGALMPDAHQGYGLPIGGVLATENAVIPYAVGVDIGCRMALSVYPLGEAQLERHRRNLRELLVEHTTFGAGQGPAAPLDDAVLSRPEFQEIKVVKDLRVKAAQQIGSSGSGNHFVEFGLVELAAGQTEWDLPEGKYVAILTHSGSRGLGAGIAQHYTRLAMKSCRLPKEARHLAWLDLDSEAGQEYWQAMNLAGDYASACHRHIHHRLAKALGESPLFTVENHHNFAWKEHLPDGSEVIVHRKGATPAGKGVLGIIPGSMVHPGYIVRGKGEAASLASASHGAGRVMSRSKAKASITRHALRKLLNEHRVDLIGGGLDEAPLAYKNIDEVMAAQTGLVEVLGQFQPRVVRMAGD